MGFYLTVLPIRYCPENSFFILYSMSYADRLHYVPYLTLALITDNQRTRQRYHWRVTGTSQSMCLSIEVHRLDGKPVVHTVYALDPNSRPTECL